MRKIIFFIAAFCAFLSAKAQTTQTEADSLVLDRMSHETKQYAIFAQKGLQNGFVITTAKEEILELDYSCWVYYVSFIEQTDKNHYLIVKESNGRILQVNTKNDGIPGDLTEWKIISEKILGSLVLIAQGNLSGHEGILKQNIVITTQTAWDSLVNTMNSIYNVSDSFAEINIDFFKYQVIAIFDILKVDGGWNICITDATEYEDNIVVVQNSKTEDSTVIVTRPYYIVKVPITEKNIVFQIETLEEEPELECDCEDELYYYSYSGKNILDTLLLNDYLFVAYDTLLQNTEMIDYINQVDLFNIVDTNSFFNLYSSLFVNLKIKRPCSQLKAIITFLETCLQIRFVNFIFGTYAPLFDYIDVFFANEFMVCVLDENDLFDLDSVAQETNTQIERRISASSPTYLLSVDKYSNGNALQMANYFHETGKFRWACPNFTYLKSH